MKFQTFQKNAWHQLFTKSIYSIFSENDFELNGVKVSFEPDNASAFLKVPANNSGSIVQTLKTKITFSREDTSATIVKPLITLPILTSNGLTLKNTRWSLINTTSPASGWYLRRDKEDNPILTLNKNAITILTIRLSNGVPTVTIASRGLDNSKKTNNVPLMTFLKAFSKDPALQYSDIVESLEDCLPVTLAYAAEIKRMKNKGLKEPTTSEAAEKVLNLLLGGYSNMEWADPISELHKRLEANFLRIGEERIPRFKRFSSFDCALKEGVTVAFPVHATNIDIKQGDALTEESVRYLDADDSVTQITVAYNGKFFTLRKYTPTETITYEEICFMLRIYSNFLQGLGEADDPDEYNNKVITSIKEYYEEYISNALYKYVTEIKKQLNSNSSVEYLVQLDFAKTETPLDYICSQINKKNFYQQLDDTNSLSIFEQEYKLTTTAKNVSHSARDIHSMQYGRVCPYTTPESKQVGLNLSLSLMSGVDKYGFITTPLFTFSNGKLSNEPVYLSAIDEMGTVIAPSSVDLEAEWLAHSNDSEYVIPNCRINGEVKPAFLHMITHREVSKMQSIGPLIATVPSAERNAGKRLIMSAAAQRQALPTWRPERPYVTTGIDALLDIGIVTARTLIEEHLASIGVEFTLVGNEKLYFVKSRKLLSELEVTFAFMYNGTNYTITRILSACTSTTKGALKYTRCASPEHTEDLRTYYALDDIVFYNNDVDLSSSKFNKSIVSFDSHARSTQDIANHGVAIGANVKVLFKSFAGYTYEDSIVVNEDFLLRQGLTVVKTTSLKYTLNANQTVAFSETVLGHHPQLNEQGYPIQGYYVQAGQAVLAISTKTDQTVKYSLETLGTGQSGFIMSYKKLVDGGKTIIRIALGEILPITLGDKLEGLHGNKGVIGRIVPANEMPYTEDGEVADIILNTLGVVARLNLGQMVEFTLGAIAESTGEIQILEPFSTDSVEEITSLAENYGIVEKDIYDGRTGIKFDKKAMIGNMYMLRLTHTNTSKFNATSNCNSNINARTMQPAKGSGGGQRMSELCTWCLMSYDANDTLSTLFTAQSDDLTCKMQLDNAIIHQESTDVPLNSSNIDLLQAYMYMFGVNVAMGDEIRLELLTQAFINSIAPRKCTVVSSSGLSATPQKILHDPNVYDSKSPENDRTTLAQLPFGCEMIMPIYLNNLQVLGMIHYLLEDEDGGLLTEVKSFSRQSLDQFLTGSLYLSGWETKTVSAEHAQYVLDNYGIKLPESYELPILALRSSSETIDPNWYGIRGLTQLFKNYDIYASIACEGEDINEKVILFSRNYNLSDFVVTSMIIPPPGFRQISKHDKKMSNPIDSRLVEVVGAIKSIMTSSSDVDKARCEMNLYNTLVRVTLKPGNEDNTSLRQQLSDHKTKGSIMRDTLLAKRMSYTGRSVITIGPDLEFGQCGVPISMLATIFDEHIVAELGNISNHYFLTTLAGVLKCEGRAFYRKAIKFLSNNNIEGFRNLCEQGKHVWDSVSQTYNSHHANNQVAVSTAQQLFDVCYQELKDILIKLLKTHPAALNREPSLHKFSVQGFEIIPIDSYAIQLHPLNCHGFNADYDGDQMAVIFPMHEKGIQDMRNKMMSVNNMIDPKDGSGIAALNQDMILGLYYATIHKDNVIKYAEAPKSIMTYYLHKYEGFEEPKGKAYGIAKPIAEDVFLGMLNIHDTVTCYYEGRRYIAEAGRIIFNSLLPGAMGFTDTVDSSSPYEGVVYELKVNYVLTKKTINKVTKNIIEYFFGYDLGKDDFDDSLASAYNRLMSFGFKMADLSGVTLSIYDFSRLPVKTLIADKMKETTQLASDIDYWYNRGFFTEEAHSSSKVKTWSAATKSMKSSLESEFKGGELFDRMSNIFMIVDSGARGDIYQLLEMSGIIGIVTNSTGESLETPILASYMDGLSPSEFSLNAYTSRRQTVTAQLSTAEAGDFSRQCIYLNDHIVIRPDDHRCDGKSLWINIDYECKLSDDMNDKEIILQDNDINSIPDEVLMESPIYLFSVDIIREQYRQFCTNVRDIIAAPVYDDNFARLLQLYHQTYFFAKDAADKYSIINVESIMSDTSKQMLMYRVLDMTAVANDNTCSGYADMFKDRAARISGAVPDTLGEDVVIDDAIITAIETAGINRVPIFTIIGCHSTEGICRCCFGLKYDTHKFPNFGEHVGYQAVQAIGNPLTQMVLDSHKSEYTNEESAKDKLERILKSRSKATEVPEEERAILPFATQDNLTLAVEFKNAHYMISLNNTAGETVQRFAIPNLLSLRSVSGDVVMQGDKIVNVQTGYYNAWLHYAPAELVQSDVWESLCECFKKENILARNFEVFARSLTEFGVARETNLDSGIIKGNIYSVNVLRASNIPFDAAFESQANVLSRGNKIIASVAFKDAAAGLCDAVLRGVSNNPSSNVGAMLLGSYKSLKHKRYTHSVIREHKTSVTEEVEVFDAIATNAVSKEQEDSITEQLLTQIDNIESKESYHQESTSDDTTEDTLKVTSTQNATGTSFFMED